MPDIDLDSQRIEPEAPGEQSWLDETNRDSLTIKIKVHHQKSVVNPGKRFTGWTPIFLVYEPPLSCVRQPCGECMHDP